MAPDCFPFAVVEISVLFPIVIEWETNLAGPTVHKAHGPGKTTWKGIESVNTAKMEVSTSYTFDSCTSERPNEWCLFPGTAPSFGTTVQVYSECK